MALAPVVDVNSNPDNPVIGVRAFGSTPSWSPGTVSRSSRASSRPAWPPVPSTSLATGRPWSTRTWGCPTVDEPDEVVRGPRHGAVRRRGGRGGASGDDGTCRLHGVRRPAGDPEPALLGLLRDEVGFDGVLFSDALDMKAISAGVGHGEGAVRTLLAGTDLICIGNPGFPATYDAEQRLDLVVDTIIAAVTEGRLRPGGSRRPPRGSPPSRSGRRPRGANRCPSRLVRRREGGAPGRHASRGDVPGRAPASRPGRGRLNIAAGDRDRHLRRCCSVVTPGAVVGRARRASTVSVIAAARRAGARCSEVTALHDLSGPSRGRRRRLLRRDAGVSG